MSLTISGRLFTGPFSLDKTAVRPNQDPAIYAIVIKRGPAWDPQFILVDAGETGENGMAFAQHPLRRQWETIANGDPAMVYLHVMPRAGADSAARQSALTELRDAYPEANMVIRG